MDSKFLLQKQIEYLIELIEKFDGTPFNEIEELMDELYRETKATLKMTEYVD